MSDLARRLARLEAMTPAELRGEWRRVLRTPPPAIPPDLLRRSIAYRLQEAVHGGLTRVVSRELAAVAARVARGGSALGSGIRLKPGTRLLRSWRDRTYTVLVADTGFVFEDRQYTSLSQIARDITGTAWSGPRFFGLLSSAND